jgi:hypothetical protein
MSQVDDWSFQDAEHKGVVPAPAKWGHAFRSWAARIGPLPVTALTFLALHLAFRVIYGGTHELGKGLDPISLVLVGIAVIPLIVPYIATAKIPGFAEITLRQTEAVVRAHTADIAELKLIISGLLSVREAEALKRVHDGIPPFREDTHRPGLTDDLRRLRALGMIHQLFDGRLTELTHGLLGERSVVECFSLTEQGRQYYDRRLRMLGEDGFKIPVRSAPSEVKTN